MIRILVSAVLCCDLVNSIAELDALPVGNDLKIVFPREGKETSETDSYTLLVTKIVAGKTIVEIHQVDDFLTAERPSFAITQGDSTMLVFNDIPSIDSFGPDFEHSYETRRFRLEAKHDVPRGTILAAVLRFFNKDSEFSRIKIWSSSTWGEAFTEAVSRRNFTATECIYASSVSDAALFKFLEATSVSSFKAFSKEDEETRLSATFFNHSTVRRLQALEVMAVEDKKLTDETLVGLEAVELNLGSAPKITQEGLRRALEPAFEARWAPVLAHKLIKSDEYANYPTFRQLFISPSFTPNTTELLAGLNATKLTVGDDSIETWSFPVGNRTLFFRHNVWHGDLHQFDVDVPQKVERTQA